MSKPLSSYSADQINAFITKTQREIRKRVREMFSDEFALVFLVTVIDDEGSEQCETLVGSDIADLNVVIDLLDATSDMLEAKRPNPENN
jgi:hypothetical protein